MDDFLKKLFSMANDPRSDEEREAESRKLVSERIKAAGQFDNNDLVICTESGRYAITGDSVVCRVVTSEPDESGGIIITALAPTGRGGVLPRFGTRHAVDPLLFRRANEFDIKAAVNEFGMRTVELLTRAPEGQRSELARAFASKLLEMFCTEPEPEQGADEA